MVHGLLIRTLIKILTYQKQGKVATYGYHLSCSACYHFCRFHANLIEFLLAEPADVARPPNLPSKFTVANILPNAYGDANSTTSSLSPYTKNHMTLPAQFRQDYSST